MDRLALFQFMLIALAFPAQYFISEYWSFDSNERSIALRKIVDGVSNFRENYLDFDAWVDWYMKLAIDVPTPYGKIKKNKKSDLGESVALEVLHYRKKLENFAESTKVRKVHDNSVKFRVGQVVKHSKYGLHGVIIGWDATAKATEEWIARNYNEEERERLTNQPHYLILVDSQYSDQFQGKSYVAEEQIELLFNMPVRNKLIKTYFDVFDGGQYTLKQFLRIIYPQD